MARLFIHFGDHADRAAPHMFHCHILEHEDPAMVGQFVLEPDAKRALSPHLHRGVGS